MFKLLGRMKRREVLMMVFCFFIILGQIYFDLTLPEFMTDLTKLIATEGTAKEILPVGMKMLGCVLSSAVLSIICGYLSARFAAGFTFSVRKELFTHVTDLGQEEMMSLSVPSLITRTTNDITQIQMMISMGLQMVIKAPVMAIWAILKILGKSWELSLLTGGFVLLIVIVVLTISFIVIPKFRLVQRLTDQINRLARENLSGINVVHAFNAEDYQNEKFDETNKKMMKTQLFNQRLFAVLMPFMGLGFNGLSLSIYWVGAALLNQIPDITARMTRFADIVVFSTYATYVVMSFMMLIMIFMMWPAAQVSAERINEVFKKVPSIKEGKETESKEQGTISFSHVSFKYPSAKEDTISDLSFDIKKGQTFAIIGATGSGKTTLVGLMARFFDATEGVVSLDGRNIKEYSFDALYERLSYITQKPVLFTGSVKENISFGEKDAGFTEEDVDFSLSLSQAEEFVSKLEDGKDSLISQGGKNVSGGQKQRLSIARALARKAEIIIFDDSFSALDYKTDALLRKGLSEKLSDATKVIVAQRISTIRHADQILVLEDGKCAGLGTHDELMKTCNVYQEIALSQLSEEELKKGGAL